MQRVHQREPARRAVVGALTWGRDLFRAGPHRGGDGERPGQAEAGEPAPAHAPSVAGTNGSGSSSRRVQRRSLRGPAAMTVRSSPNSASNWRHAPQGDAGGSTSVAPARPVKVPAPPPTPPPPPIPPPPIRR